MALGKVSVYLPVLAGLLGNWSLFYDASSAVGDMIGSTVTGLVIRSCR